MSHDRSPAGKWRWASLVMAGLLLSGCAATAPVDPVATAPVPENLPEVVVTQPREASVPHDAFDQETLYELLVAEMALRQGDHATALEHYVRQARRTRDPAVVAQAVRLTAVSRDDRHGPEMARLWVELAPTDPVARQAAAIALIRTNSLQEALEHLAELRAQSGSASFGELALQAAALQPEARSDLLAALAAVHARFPDDPDLAFARSALLEQMRQYGAALALLDTVPPLELSREAVLLRARLLDRLGRRDEAIDWLGEWIERGIDATRLRYTRARLLIAAGRLGEARSDFERLLARLGEQPEILMSLALLAVEQSRLVEARDYLERLLATGRRREAALFYLGELAWTEGDAEAAVAAYRQVPPGRDFHSAQLRAGALLLDQAGPDGLAGFMAAQRERYPEEDVRLWVMESGLLLETGADDRALDVLDAAIAVHPDDSELRFTRALGRKRTDDLAGMEHDFRHILTLEPDNSMALNALGYVLADRTDRFEEAKVLIERALAVRPDEPAYVDSLGWVEYRLGNLEVARELLEQAYSAMPDHEIAAHLGEVLWVSGDRDAALLVWQEGLELDPDSPVLAETMRRLMGTEGIPCALAEGD